MARPAASSRWARRSRECWARSSSGWCPLEGRHNRREGQGRGTPPVAGRGAQCVMHEPWVDSRRLRVEWSSACLLYTSDAADDLLCVDLGGRRIIKKKKNKQ